MASIVKTLVAALFVHAVAASWIILPSANLDVHAQCGCSGTCKDIPGKYHFAGTLLNDSACASTCEAASGNCTMWFRSAHSNHCWWKMGNDWDPVHAPGLTSGCLSTVPGCGTIVTPTPSPTPPPSPLPPIISGQGKFRYKYDPEKLKLPASVKLVNGHGE
jgi:hypothetical protein